MGVFKIFADLISDKVLPTISNAKLPPQDSEEEIANIGERVVGGEFLILGYRDSNDNESTRRITVYTVRDGLIKAWCHERDAFRTFRVAGVTSLATLEGEVFDNLEEMLPVEPVTKEKPTKQDWQKEPYYWVEDGDQKQFFLIWDEILPEVILLRAIARSDGFADKTENEVICKYVRERYATMGHELQDKQLTQAKRKIKGLYPEEFEIKDAAPQLNTLSQDEIRDFLRCCKDTINADGVVMDSEMKLFHELGNAVIAEYKAHNA